MLRKVVEVTMALAADGPGEIRPVDMETLPGRGELDKLTRLIVRELL